MATKFKTNVVLQIGNESSNVADIVAKAKEAFLAEGHKASEIKDIAVYLKSEDGLAYYVINGEAEGKVSLF